MRFWRHHGDDRLLFAGHEESPGKTVEVDGELQGVLRLGQTSTRANTSTWKASASSNPSRAGWPTLVEGAGHPELHQLRGRQEAQADIRKVNYVILGGDNAGEHLLMRDYFLQQFF